MPLGTALFIAWSAVVAWCDCRDRRIANGLVIAGGAAAFACAVSHGSPFAVTPVQAALGFVAGFAALLPFYLLGVMGAADVKVFAMLGAWCGSDALLGLWIVASIAAAVHALTLIVIERIGLRDAGAGAGVGAGAWTPWRNAQPTFAIGARRATPYAALLVGAGSLHLLGRLLQGAVH
ncbi:MAG: A24 family peptidase [Trinickia sp.]|uniref:A24 family peptidase n=1 Tax=Trinickia sp. TaxID=2571163 RepID=UPI003F7DA16B